MSIFSIDIEADGPAPGLYSMISFGAVVVDRDLDKTFYGELAPITDDWIPQALAVSGFSREETLEFPRPYEAISSFAAWVDDINDGKRPMFYSDNNGFDWQFMNYYLHRFIGSNPFGWSSHNIGDVCMGRMGDKRIKFRKYRKTKHTHNPLDDARGNAEAMIYCQENFGCNFFLDLK